MQLEHPFYQFPFCFNAQKIHNEIQQIDDSEWISHPQQYQGNDALILVSVQGTDNHATNGSMLPCPRLKKLPYLRQVLAHFNTVIGRTRLMKLAPHSSVPLHSDIKYYWRHHLRIHIPIQTNKRVSFTSRDKTVHMKAGEAWAFDNWSKHTVINDGDEERIHLVIDTVGSSQLWKQLREVCWNHSHSEKVDTLTLIDHQPQQNSTLSLERYNSQSILHPVEVTEIIQSITTELAEDCSKELHNVLLSLQQTWRAHWSLHGHNPHEGYSSILQTHVQEVLRIAPQLKLPSNNVFVHKVLSIQLSDFRKKRPPQYQPTFDQPIFIVAAPRSGSTMLYETLSNNLALWTIAGESHNIFESIPALRPDQRKFESNALYEQDATPEIANQLRNNFIKKLQRQQRHILNLPLDKRPSTIRLLEKTPKNSLRIDFLHKIFPDARFIYLYRRPEANISSIMNGWKSGRFVTYKKIPNWHGSHPWSFLLPKGWQKHSGSSLAELAWFQYRSANDAIISSLEKIPSQQIYHIEYDDFLANRAHHIQQLCHFCKIPFGQRMINLCKQKELPLSRYTIDPPNKNKWMMNAVEMQQLLPIMREYFDRKIATS